MARGNSIRVRGFEEIFRTMRELDKKAQNQITRRVLRESQKVFQSEVKARAPRRSGDLAKSIKVRATKRKRGKVGMQVVMGNGHLSLAQAQKRFDRVHRTKNVKKRAAAVRAFNKAYYGAFINFGWRTGSRKSRARTKLVSVRKAGQKGRLKQFEVIEHRRSIAPNPFVERAFKAKGPELQRRLPHMYWNELRKLGVKRGAVR